METIIHNVNLKEKTEICDYLNDLKINILHAYKHFFLISRSKTNFCLSKVVNNFKLLMYIRNAILSNVSQKNLHRLKLSNFNIIKRLGLIG